MLAYRGHPAPADPELDHTSGPMTLVEFRLADVANGTELTVTESGLDRISPARRIQAFRMGDEGWTKQVLADAGLVRDVRQGREHYGEFEPDRLDQARRSLDQVSR